MEADDRKAPGFAQQVDGSRQKRREFLEFTIDVNP
jgi:hypothetical protein